MKELRYSKILAEDCIKSVNETDILYEHYVPINVYMAIFGQDFTGLFLNDIATYKLKKRCRMN